MRYAQQLISNRLKTWKFFTPGGVKTPSPTKLGSVIKVHTILTHPKFVRIRCIVSPPEGTKNFWAKHTPLNLKPHNSKPIIGMRPNFTTRAYVKLQRSHKNVVKIEGSLDPMRDIYMPKLRKIFMFGDPTPAPVGWNLAYDVSPLRTKKTQNSPPPWVNEIPAYSLRAAASKNSLSTFG